MVKKATQPNADAILFPEAGAFDAQRALNGVMLTDDVLEYHMRCVLALAPGLNEEIIRHATRHTRLMFKGARAYIAAREGEGTTARNEAIRRDYRNGERLELLERRYGIGRVQIWRIVNDVPSH